MAEDRIRTILKEIHHWKQHKLLPEVYCDFLIALYSNGEGVDDKISDKARTPTSVVISFFFLMIFLVLSFILVYLSNLSLPITISCLFLFWILSSLLFFLIRSKDTRKRYHYLSLVALLLMTMLITVFIGTSLFDKPFVANLTIILNFIAWLIISVIFRYKWLIFISFLGFIFTFFYILF